jgi:hypothetical protein
MYGGYNMVLKAVTASFTFVRRGIILAAGSSSTSAGGGGGRGVGLVRRVMASWRSRGVLRLRGDRLADLGFGRIVASEIEGPNILVNLA